MLMTFVNLHINIHKCICTCSFADRRRKRVASSSIGGASLRGGGRRDIEEMHAAAQAAAAATPATPAVWQGNAPVDFDPFSSSQVDSKAQTPQLAQASGTSPKAAVGYAGVSPTSGYGYDLQPPDRYRAVCVTVAMTTMLA